MSLPLGGPALQSALQDAGLNTAMPAWTVWVAVGLVALSTLAGAHLAHRNAARISIWLAVASALMLITALTDVMPDAWREAAATEVPLWVVALAGLTGFAAITYFTRHGCAHPHQPGQHARHAPGLHRRVKQAVSAAVYGGVGTAVALSLHRMIEGATLVLAASAIVVAALMIHSAGEGLAMTAMLDMASKRRAPWLLLSCASPAAGVVLATVAPLPPQSVPILLGLLTGVLLRTAVIGLQIARTSGRMVRRHVAVAAVGVLAVGALLVTGEAMFAGDLPTPELPVAAAGQAAVPLVPHTRTPSPLPTPTRRPEPMTPSELRAAVAGGRLGLESLLTRSDLATIGADVEWLLRALPGRSAAEITRVLRRARVGSGASIGDLTLRQRHYLLLALGAAPAPR
ncbi:hypothetical protein FH608_037810 [Nonomuraea phyllanthi]|uniref:Uncharacterized protein n=1 Tax=Nonomuraea phyllanthi TaxID=2219224 RepID=A0A5C4VQE1_9ACTN|nr:hypothetical protein [Nonomuraea phyllanthi]KAB8189768.1 hypothetical protein FH608_037810 [Nonomuraea phyllanthi]QFY08724.1 hypothetical protein GBF35_20415 [Nonomuraea phyllanthi]